MSIALLACVCVAGCLLAGEGGDPYSQLAGYKYESSRKPLSAIEASVREASPEQLKEIEGKLLKILQSPETTADAKGWICGVLRQIGTEQAVAPVAALLADEDVSVRACIAMQSLPGPKADEALREAAAKLPTELKATVLQSIGARGDRKAVAAIAPLANDKDAGVASAALIALGKIGSTEARDALQKASVPAEMKITQAQALLLCAHSLTAEGKNSDAAAICSGVLKAGESFAVKVAALRGLVVSDKVQGAAAVSAALKDKDRRMQMSALQCLADTADGEILGKVLADLGSLDPEQQAFLLGLAQDKAVLPAAVKALQSEHAAVRTAAIKAVGRVGGAAEVPALLALCGKGDADGKDALAALGALKDPKADEALAGLLTNPAAATRVSALELLKARNATKSVPEILTAAGDAEESVRTAAFDALAALAGADRYQALVQLMLDARSDGERTAAEKAVIATARKVEKPADGLAPLSAALKNAAAPGKAAALRVMAVLGGPDALGLVRERLPDADAVVADAAARAIANWPDAAAVNDMMGLMKNAAKPAHKVLAWRGYLRLAKSAEIAPETRLKMLEQAKPLAQAPEEKRLLLSGLSDGGGTMEALELAATFLDDNEVKIEAQQAARSIMKALGNKADKKRLAPIQEKLGGASGSAKAHPAAKNIAKAGKASSLSGWKPDGEGKPAPAAIDGNENTYWDEDNDKPEYRIAVSFDPPKNVTAISILGFQHHEYAPREFTILADGKAVKSVVDAQYENNVYWVEFPAVQAKTIELKITGYYGQSPAIRELGIYEP
jgi:HEAT repeat protein